MKKILILMLVIVLLVSPVLATPFTQNEIVDIRHTVTSNGSLSGVNWVNITIKDPDNIVLVPFQAMVFNTDSQDYNYTLRSSNTSKLGTYPYIVCTSTTSGDTCESFQFIITPTGTILTTGESILYLVLMFILFLIFSFVVYLAVIIPYSNEMNNKGAVVRITRKKYVKLSLILISYTLLIWIFNLLVALSTNFTNLSQYSGFVSFLFTTLINLSIVIPVAIIIIMGIEWIRDIYTNKEIKKFGSHIK